MARKQYRTWPQGQSFLFPPSPEEWLPDDHLVYFLLDVVDVLDITAIEQVIQNKDPRGEWPYNPRMMLALLVYSYCSGIYSSRKIATATHEQVAFRVLTGNQHPHFTRISAFRREHLAAFRGLFVQVLQLCQDAGLVKLGHVALDGTKVPANASKHKAMSYDRMKQLDLKLGAEIDELLARAKAADSADDARLGVGQDESDIPEELRRRKDRRSKLRAAKAALEAEAKAARAQHELELADGCDERADTAEKDSDRPLEPSMSSSWPMAATSARTPRRRTATESGTTPWQHNIERLRRSWPTVGTATIRTRRSPPPTVCRCTGRRPRPTAPPRTRHSETSRTPRAGSCRAVGATSRATTRRRWWTSRTRSWSQHR